MKLPTTEHPTTMMWGCAAIVLVAVILGLTGNAYALLFVLPCMLMMGAMVWMMMGGATRRDGNGSPDRSLGVRGREAKK